MPNARMFPPGDGKHNTIKANGRSCTCALGSFIDVPSADAHVLSANGWTRAGGGTCEVGPTSARPQFSSGGQPLAADRNFLDTTLGMIITWRPPVGGAPGAWIHPLTGAAV